MMRPIWNKGPLPNVCLQLEAKDNRLSNKLALVSEYCSAMMLQVITIPQLTKSSWNYAK